MPALITMLQKLRELTWKQLKTNTVLDRETLDNSPLKRDRGFKTANKIFNGQLGELLAEMNEIVWDKAG